MGEILNIMEGYQPVAPVRLARAAAPRGRGDASRVHRPQHVPRRPRVREEPARPAAVQGLRRELRSGIGERASPTPAFNPGAKGGSSTTHYSVVDAEGNAVSCTTTLNNSYGSAVTVTGAGFLLNDEMDDFATAPGKPNMYGLVQGEANAIAPGKRMLSAMTPSIVVDSSKRLYLVVGTPGGPRIITMVYHVISNVLDHHMTLADAVDAPRMHHQGLPDSLRVEGNGFSAATLDSLRARGHARVDSPDTGATSRRIIRTAHGWQGVSDGRYGGGGAGY